MNDQTILEGAALEFEKIRAMLCEHAVSERGRERMLRLTPFLNERECKKNMRETTEARLILDRCSTPPIASMKGILQLLDQCEKGAMLLPEQLLRMADFLFTCKKMKEYLKKAEETGSGVAAYGGSIEPLAALCDTVRRSLRADGVEDSASPALRDIRRKIGSTNAKIKEKLEHLLRSRKDWFSDGYIAVRGGHFVLPVKREFRAQVAGTLLDTSSSGGTFFIEPAGAAKLCEEVAALTIGEENEVRRILYALCALIDGAGTQIRQNLAVMEELDFLFAKAKLSEQMKAIPVPVTGERKIVIKKGRHPLLKSADCVPLDFAIGDGARRGTPGEDTVRGVVITGPNTGGKTVALKTVGLLSVMAQCGLHVPVEEGSVFCLHNLILCDIGDGQSIAENLSTFSAHLTAIIGILEKATDESLVLLDELGSGTDPAEGMGIAVAVLEELRRRGCLFVVTTHYPEIKEYAKEARGVENARMAFDRESLRPLFRLTMGEAGESCALYIAQRLHFPAHLLAIARQAAYGSGKEREREKAGCLPAAFSPAGEQSPAAACAASPRVQREKRAVCDTARARLDAFQVGDCVTVEPGGEIGIVYETADERGNVGVQIKKEKRRILYKRLTRKVAASELYPPDYDFSVVFDTVANRKARRVMERRHDPDAVIELEKGRTEDE